jgi:hypothetical protein
MELWGFINTEYYIPVRLIGSKPKSEAYRGEVAIARGTLNYSIENYDVDFPVGMRV